MKIKKIVLYCVSIFSILIIGFLTWVLSLDDTYDVKRTIKIEKNIDIIWPYVYDFKNWNKWSPWVSIDSKARVGYRVNPAGAGSLFHWESDLVGTADIEHKKINFRTEIVQELRFSKPVTITSDIKWSFEPVGNSTIVTWHISGKIPFFLRIYKDEFNSNFKRDLDRGLLMLKDISENGSVNSIIKIEGVVMASEITFFGKRVTCEFNDIETNIKKQFFALLAYSFQHKIPTPKKALTIYEKFGFDDGLYEFIPGFSIDNNIEIKGKDFEKRVIPKTKTIKIVFIGYYKHIPNGWTAGFVYARRNNLKINTKIAPYEIYYKNPNALNNMSDLMTEIYIPIK